MLPELHHQVCLVFIYDKACRSIMVNRLGALDFKPSKSQRKLVNRLVLFSKIVWWLSRPFGDGIASFWTEKQTSKTTYRILTARGTISLALRVLLIFSSHDKGKKTFSMFPTFSLSDSIHASEIDSSAEKEPAHKFEVNSHSFHRSYNSNFRE